MPVLDTGGGKSILKARQPKPVRIKGTHVKCTIPKAKAIREFEQCLTKKRSNCSVEAHKVRIELRKLGYHQLGSGIHREALGKHGEGCVIKLAKHTYGAEANKNEIRVWNEVRTSGAANIFAPILSHGKAGSYLVMPKMKDVGSVSTKEREKVRKLLNKHNLYCTDLNPNNLAHDKKGKTVIIDYGFGLNCGRYDKGIIPDEPDEDEYMNDYPDYPDQT